MARRKRRRHRRNPETRRTRVRAARKGWRRRRHHRNPVVSHRRRSHRVHHRRRYHRNPRIGGSTLRIATEGLKCGAFIVAGEAASSVTAGFIPFLSNTGVIGAAKIGLTGTLLGVFGRRVLGRYAPDFIGGAWAKAIRVAIAPYAASIPLLGPGLSGYASLPVSSGMSGYAPRIGMSGGVEVAADGSGYTF